MRARIIFPIAARLSFCAPLVRASTKAMLTSRRSFSSSLFRFDERKERTLLINKVSFSLSEKDIEKAFEPIGGIKKVVIEREVPSDKRPGSFKFAKPKDNNELKNDPEEVAGTESRPLGRSRGYGRIEFETKAKAEQAFKEMQGLVIDNLPIVLTPQPLAKANQEAEAYPILYIRNLPYDKKESDVMEIFGPHQALRCGLARAPITNLSLGYGFIRFPNPESALTALRATKGTTIGGRRIKVSMAKPQPHDYKYIV